MKPTELLSSKLNDFLNAPFPLWETSLTSILVQAKYEQLIDSGIINRDSYSTTAALNKVNVLPNKQFLVRYDGGVIYLEKPDFEILSRFYEEHGLIPLSELELVKNEGSSKVKAALDLLNLVPECISCISNLVNCIQVITAENPEFDTSYSHPNIPFTIFVSVCKDHSSVCCLRVAESILHEAMHLKLTLIENVVELTNVESENFYYSPWREEKRPIQGVFHGLFVFRAIYDFYQNIFKTLNYNLEIKKFVSHRLTDIRKEISILNSFSEEPDLSKKGKALVNNLCFTY